MKSPTEAAFKDVSHEQALRSACCKTVEATKISISLGNLGFFSLFPKGTLNFPERFVR